MLSSAEGPITVTSFEHYPICVPLSLCTYDTQSGMFRVYGSVHDVGESWSLDMPDTTHTSVSGRIWEG